MTVDVADLAERVAAGCPDVVARFGQGAPHRETALVGGVRCIRMGVDTGWSTQAYLMYPADLAGLDDVVAWLMAHAPAHVLPAYVVTVRAAMAGHPALTAHRLTVVDELPVYALDAAEAAATHPPPGDLEIGPPADRAEFVTAYGGGFGDLALAEALVVEADLGDPSWPHRVGRLDGVAIGSAKVRLAAGCGYVSAVGVLPAYRRRGHGAALTAAATALALAAGVEVVWLNATPSGRAVYERLGYRQVDTHLHLAPGG